MIRTVVCARDGCNGNSFSIKTEDRILYGKCNECGEMYEFDISSYEYTILSSCSHCNNDTFKLFKDTEKEGVFAKCIKCGNPPEKIYIDSDGNQVSYEAKKLSDIKEIIYLLEQRTCTIESKVDGLRGGQELLEESIAYLNRFLSDHS
ncbi:hypothetical protein [Clostridium fallax]|uniref:Uncharacterized protein n=1 Tax=Clostridium fallax TaxID=1533 RepID=A0A1M4Z0X6_9CLOT|nr:hypothetical protein [Clostridium fallax]SHF11704.1 hypothetical protein SAMN05443638_1358 [Clostridium fallax]SQB22208.1 Uncharacterised protein [Clostridium fallax]